MLILLIGPKGSGKSHVARLLDATFPVRSFDTEVHWLRYHSECAAAGEPVRIDEGIKRIHLLIGQALATNEHVCVDTTGASPEILKDLLSIGSRYGVFLAKIEASLSVCLKRIAARDLTTQIPIEPNVIRKVFDISQSLSLDYDLILNNEQLSDDEILDRFEAVGFRGRLKGLRPDATRLQTRHPSNQIDQTP